MHPRLPASLPLLASLLLCACGGGGSSSSSPSPPPVNSLPQAVAGADQSVTAGAGVTLDASASTDPDGSITGYVWSQTGGTTVTLSSSSTAQPTFTAPSVSIPTTLTFSLRVVDNSGATSDADTVNVTVNPAITGNINGRVRFTRIPTTDSGLNYAAGTLLPARGILVLAVVPGTEADEAADAGVLDSTTTTDDGGFVMNIDADTSYSIIAVARMLRDAGQPLPRWNMSVVDVATDEPYTFTDGDTYNTGTTTMVDYAIPSGHGSNGAVTGTRAAAPFAILDTLYQAMQFVLGAAPLTDFPALRVDWAPDNIGGNTFFNPNPPQTMVLSADVTEDTDEFDQHVIAHEFGHYVEFNFARADNIGGAHGLGDKLDIRVAFGEGFGYAFGAMVLDDPVSHDTFTSSTQFLNCMPGSGGFLCSSRFNVEDNPPASGAGSPPGNTGCWCSESSVWSILWDLYDATADANDTLALGFQPLWNILVNQQRNTSAFTSIFSFINALKAARPGDAAAIDTLLAAQNIDSVQDAFGSGETHFPNTVAQNAALPLYTSVTVDGPPVVLRNVDDAGQYNMLGNHRFVTFTLPTARTITITLSTSNPAGDADPDFVVYRNGGFIGSGEDGPPGAETETFINAAAGTYVLDIYDCANGCSAPQGSQGDYDLTLSVN